MIEIIITVVLEVAKCLAAPLGRRFAYVRNYRTNFEKLNQDVEKLKLAKDRVQRKVEDAFNNIEEIEPEVKVWQNKVESIIDQAEKLFEDNANNRCFKGSCPNLMTRHKHSKKASTEIDVISQLLQQEKGFDKVSFPINMEDIRLTSSEDFEAFESRNMILKNILSALDETNVHHVGIYGMGGIGKTTLVKEVARQAKNNKLFDEVVFVEISENQNIKKIQDEIAGQLDLKDARDEALESLRANKLNARLNNGKKILLILDNIWGELDLKTIGIPSGAHYGGCKILLTTRDREVLSIMGSKVFDLGVLSGEEAWRLFKKMAGNYIGNPELKSVANDIVKECCGLPVAIVTVAKALRNKEKFEWDDALRELRRPAPENLEGVLEKTYSKIEFSYNKLKGEELKQIFLLCCLMENNASVSDLLRYVMGLNILQGDIPKMEQKRNRLLLLS